MNSVPGGRVDSVAEEAVARHLPADDPGHARPRVDSDSEEQRFARVVADLEGLDLAQEVKGEGRDLEEGGCCHSDYVPALHI